MRSTHGSMRAHVSSRQKGTAAVRAWPGPRHSCNVRTVLICIPFCRQTPQCPVALGYNPTVVAVLLKLKVMVLTASVKRGYNWLEKMAVALLCLVRLARLRHLIKNVCFEISDKGRGTF